jgi:DNA-binding NarL/FixJ family response regulator
MQEIATGDTFVEIGNRLGMREQTVKNHANDARRRLGADTNIEAFVRMGWLRVPFYSWGLSNNGDWILTDVSA